MSDDFSIPEDWSPSKRAKYRIIKRAFRDFEGAKAILRIQWLQAKEAHHCELEKPQSLEHFKAVADEHRREEALKAARETDRAKAMSLFGAMTAPTGMRFN